MVDPKDADAHAIVAFDRLVQSDSRVENVCLTVRDGMMLRLETSRWKVQSRRGPRAAFTRFADRTSPLILRTQIGCRQRTAMSVEADRRSRRDKESTLESKQRGREL